MKEYLYLIIPSIALLARAFILEIGKIIRIVILKDVADSKIKSMGEYEKKANLWERLNNKLTPKE